ncbi:MAG: Smr/MutS family protein [Comamonas sp.]|nr:Smr/MutS family protein [Comamonas sp.]
MSQAFRHQGLHALGGIAKELKLQRKRQEAADLARKAAPAAAERERNLFTHFVGAVIPLPRTDRFAFEQAPPTPRRLQHELDEERVLHEAMSDEFDVSTLLDVDDQLSFRRPGIGLDVTHKLRGGHWSIQRQLDLHGLRSDEAREALGQFIRLSHRTGLRCVRVVHGKGLGSPGRTPILKAKVQRWLVQKKEVLAFVQARPADGGAGALVVLLQPGKRKLY